MKVRYTETARREAEEIFERIVADNPAAAAAVVRAVRRAITTLGRFPLMGSKTDDPTVLVKIARPYHYLIFYTIEDEVLFIRRVRHPARRRSDI